MHNGKASWDGTSDEAYTVDVTWKVVFASSDPKTRSADFKIAPGDSAVDVAKNLSKEWNKKNANRKYPSCADGTTIVFSSTKHDCEIVGMRVEVDGGKKSRIPASGTEVKIVDGLFVHRSAYN